ncbi:MAG TPA: hypothetical protein VFK02_25640 [Kofleriaceae bacterium]|nr:hypothetical protein [Kofleriaceae bacterium]
MMEAFPGIDRLNERMLELARTVRTLLGLRDVAAIVEVVRGAVITLARADGEQREPTHDAGSSART